MGVTVGLIGSGLKREKWEPNLNASYIAINFMQIMFGKICIRLFSCVDYKGKQDSSTFAGNRSKMENSKNPVDGTENPENNATLLQNT